MFVIGRGDKKAISVFCVLSVTSTILWFNVAFDWPTAAATAHTVWAMVERQIERLNCPQGAPDPGPQN